MKGKMFWVMVCILFGLNGFCQTTVEEFYTAEGASSPITLNGGQKCGQHFTATQPFDGVEVNGPTWSVSGEKGMTIRLYKWAGNYDATVAQKPMFTRVLENLDDNGWFPCYASATLPAGEYFWEASEPTNSNPDATDPYQIGCWLWDGSKYTGGEAYFNGKPYVEAAVVWEQLYATGQNGTWTPYPFSKTDPNTMAQSFQATGDFSAVGFHSPTWNGTGAGYRLTLYKWVTDYNTSISKTPIGQAAFTNISDNGFNELYLKAAQPAGQYLAVTDQPVYGTGNVGHWGWSSSDYADDNNVAFIDGVATSDYASFDIKIGYVSEETVGKDFASRSVTDIEFPAVISDWELQ